MTISWRPELCEDFDACVLLSSIPQSILAKLKKHGMGTMRIVWLWVVRYFDWFFWGKHAP